MATINSNLQELVREVLVSAQQKYDRDNTDNTILHCKNAKVIWYQPRTLIACVHFLLDEAKDEYHLFNYSHCFLSPGDNVKVYYTTNAAKGWIEIRCGSPNFMNEYGQLVDDIRNCCDEDEDNGDCCCDTTCCEEAATRQQNKDIECVEEWDERIEGTEDEIREYEEKEGKNSPFYKFEQKK